MPIIPVIMAGGSGTRLWPLSRTAFPKQFLSIASESSLFQQAVLRGNLFSTCRRIVVANEEHRLLVAE
jgi:mannose-1-phosphate guanylyltransferase